MNDDEVAIYLLDRAGLTANAFAAKLEGREGVALAGGADNVDEALEDIGSVPLDVILVGTDLGGTGVVDAVEKILAIAPDVAVVVLSSVADKALVAQAVRAGAAGSLDRTATPGETIAALHVYRRRQHGETVDISLAEPAAQTRGLRVSGALPRFPSVREENPERSLIGADEAAEVEGATRSEESAAELSEPVETHEAAAQPTEAAETEELEVPVEAAQATPESWDEPLPPSEAPKQSWEERVQAPATRESWEEDQAAETAGAGGRKPKRGFLGFLFGGRDDAESGWGPKTDGHEEESESR